MNYVSLLNQKAKARCARQLEVKAVKVKRTRKQWLELFRRAREIAQTSHRYEFSELK
jgi:hypothetical protein